MKQRYYPRPRPYRPKSPIFVRPPLAPVPHQVCSRPKQPKAPPTQPLAATATPVFSLSPPYLLSILSCLNFLLFCLYCCVQDLSTASRFLHSLRSVEMTLPWHCHPERASSPHPCHPERSRGVYSFLLRPLRFGRGDTSVAITFAPFCHFDRSAQARSGEIYPARAYTLHQYTYHSTPQYGACQCFVHKFMNKL